MTQPRYILHFGRTQPPVQIDDYRVYPDGDYDRSAPLQRSSIDAVLLRSRTLHNVEADGEPIRGTGRGVLLTSAGVKAGIRQLRPQEATRLDALDDKLGELREALAGVREERVALVREAWTKAHTVTLTEVNSRLSEKLAEMTHTG